MSFYHPLQVIRPEVLQVGSGRTDATGMATITFPKPFPSPPKVFVQGVDATTRGIVLDVFDVTTTGFKVRARRVTDMAFTTDTVGDHTHANPRADPAGDHKHTACDLVYLGKYGTPAESVYLELRDGVEGKTQATLLAFSVATIPTARVATSIDGSHDHYIRSTSPAGAHSHTGSVSAPTLAVDFFWLAIAL